jgi:omega-6 fatty acid desaturase (delta-12 desaturase)
MTRSEYARSPRSVRAKYLFMRHPLTILLGYVFVFQFGMCIYPFLNKPRAHADCLFAFLLHVAIALVLTQTLGWPALLLTLVVPHLIGSALGAYLFYAQHNFPGVSFHDRSGWAYEKAALESSSFLKTGAVMAWFTANIGYHHIHHLNARIPFYRLPEVLREVPELGAPKTTSLHPAEIFRCLRIKVWDVEAQRMVPLKSRRRESRAGR